MRYRQAATATLAAAFLIGAATAGATATSQHVGASGPDTTRELAASSQSAPNSADVEFTQMMIPHHYQALVMTRMVRDRSTDQEVRDLAERINVEQSVEIDSMQGWQERNDLEVTNAQEAYERLLDQPEKLEEMGMATRAELDDLRAARGTDFDVLFLELMIEHHEGAIDMCEQVIMNGSDTTLRQMAMDMMSTQDAQIERMRDMLEKRTS